MESGSYGSSTADSLNEHTLLRLPVFKADKIGGESLIYSRYPDFYTPCFFYLLYCPTNLRVGEISKSFDFWQLAKWFI